MASTSLRLSPRRRAIAAVPDGASVTATYQLLPHLSHRRHVYDWPNPFWAAVWGNDDCAHLPDPTTVDYVVIDKTQIGSNNIAIYNAMRARPHDDWVPRVRVLAGASVGTELSFGPNEGLTIGRGDECDLRLLHAKIKTVHALVRPQGRALGLLFQTSCQLGVVQFAQLRREGAERHLAQAALVILCGKGHQLTPTAVQRRQAFQGSGDVLEGLGRQIGGCQTVVPDHAEHLSPAQRYPHQRSRLQRHGAAVAQQIAHTTVCRRLHGDFDPMVCGGGHGAIKTVSRFSNFLDIRVKCLIFLIFRCDSDFLWITLLKTGCCGPGTLENQAFGQNAHSMCRKSTLMKSTT